MTLLTTTDLHLTDRPRDAYRFKLFGWLRKQQEKHNPRATLILGDITDQKDRHSSKLVNRLVDEIITLKPPVYILKGNHDYLSPENPFFRFLSHMKGIHFIVERTQIWDGVYMVPHCRTQEEFDASCGNIAPKPEGIYLHATFEGATAESGMPLTGLQASPIELLHPLGCWAGDVHRPQRCGPVTYVGSPYSVRFGDNFTPRVLLIDKAEKKNLYFDCPRKWALTIHDAADLQSNDDLRANDQVKLTVELQREEVVEWGAIKRRVLDVCKEMELENYGVTMKMDGPAITRKQSKGHDAKRPEEIYSAYCKHEKLASNIADAGKHILEE